jgi:hypothetical protein
VRLDRDDVLSWKNGLDSRFRGNDSSASRQGTKPGKMPFQSIKAG